MNPNEETGRSISVWMPDVIRPKTLTLTADLTTDVCVIGSGIAGLSTAYLLAKEGISVVVLEGGVVTGGESERTSAHLASALDDRFYWLERRHGVTGARLAYESHAAAIDRIERAVRDESIACAFERVDGFLFVPKNEPNDILWLELAAAQRAGAPAQRVTRAPLADFDTGPALRFARQAQFQPLAYCAGLVRAIVERGGRLYTRTHVTKVKGGRHAHVQTDQGHRVSAKAIVVTSNTPFNDRFAIHTKQEPYRTYVIAAEIDPQTFTHALYWDTGDPYHYVRCYHRADYDRGEGNAWLVIGGEDHKTGQADDAEQRYQRLEVWMRERFPSAGAVAFRWSGQILEPIDGLAFIGKNPLDGDNVYVATGDSGHGLTHGTIAGMLITDLIAGRDNPWAALYDPARKTLASVGDYVKAQASVALHYGDWLAPGDVRTIAEIPSGQSRIVRNGLRLQAVHRDDQGKLRACSAVCTHLGGIVHWNGAEQSWDCPLHGSRFSADGEVICGPALKRLGASRA